MMSLGVAPMDLNNNPEEERPFPFQGKATYISYTPVLKLFTVMGETNETIAGKTFIQSFQVVDVTTMNFSDTEGRFRCIVNSRENSLCFMDGDTRVMQLDGPADHAMLEKLTGKESCVMFGLNIMCSNEKNKDGTIKKFVRHPNARSTAFALRA
jgi:hypothetical protein